VNEHKIDASEKDSYLNSDFGLVPPDAPGRRFAVSHEGDYAGNRYHLDPAWKAIHDNLPSLKKFAAKRRSLQLTLDKVIQEQVNLAAEVDEAEAVGERYFVIKEGDAIRAVRRLRGGKALDLSTLDETLSQGFEPEELPEAPWSSLVP
jgi:hypothetical protein